MVEREDSAAKHGLHLIVGLPDPAPLRPNGRSDTALETVVTTEPHPNGHSQTDPLMFFTDFQLRRGEPMLTGISARSIAQELITREETSRQQERDRREAERAAALAEFEQREKGLIKLQGNQADYYLLSLQRKKMYEEGRQQAYSQAPRPTEEMPTGDELRRAFAIRDQMHQLWRESYQPQPKKVALSELPVAERVDQYFVDHGLFPETSMGNAIKTLFPIPPRKTDSPQSLQ